MRLFQVLLRSREAASGVAASGLIRSFWQVAAKARSRTSAWSKQTFDRAPHSRPGPRSRVDQLEVFDVGQEHELAMVTVLDGLLVIPSADRAGNRGVCRPVYERVRDAEGQQRHRRSHAKDVGPAQRVASKESIYRVLAEFQFGTPNQIDSARQRYSALDHEWGGASQKVLFSEPVPGSGPKSQVPTGRKTSGHHPSQVQLVRGRNLLKKVDGGTNVFKRPRPAAPIFADSAVLNVPGGEAFFAERVSQVGVRIQVVSCTPPPSVDTNNHWMGPGTGRQSQVGELARRYAISQPSVIGRYGASQKIERAFHR